MPGFFHIKMACAEAIWKIFIEATKPGPGGSSHKHSIFTLCALLRPKEIAKIGSNPGFRMQHTLINHVLAASILLCWTNEVRARYGYGTLEEWAKHSPTYDDFVDISEEIVKSHVAPQAFHPPTEDEGADMVRDTMKVWNWDALLYTMTSHAANTGDVGRVEQLLLLWIYIWKGVGKHKYAKHITDFLLNLNEGWPPRLSRAIRLNWLVNPTGKPDGFRGVDWVLEWNNLRHKRTHSGQGPNQTIRYIIKQSPLVEVFQNTHKVIEVGFALTSRTLKHPPPVMKKTLEHVRSYMESEKMLTLQRGRKLGKKAVVDYALKATARWMQAMLESMGNIF
ncbi:hypothetical protein BOTBODRAFT_56741 [Botryobasidium botryosum FD-172 SS1]|uniref:DUF6589 domain-containing protein n=1 Tax=Botryobasidium botryosum (strain FD-172 SS1) TaxID=930990 RepID=A0A067M9L8_BOTB1|nr:hypothetical protein BOTBODRAFT_56741 [Botryobasidium botryosum FD-172 SS1]